MRIPYIPVYAYMLVDNKIVVGNWSAMYVGDNTYRIFYGKQKSKDYYNINEANMEKIQYDMIHLHIVFLSFNNNDELKFINTSLSLFEENLSKEKYNLDRLNEMIDTENYYCNKQTTMEMILNTTGRIKNISKRIKLFNKLKGQYNEHN